MTPIQFKGQTVIIAKDQPEYLPLPAFRRRGDPMGETICCWRLRWHERLAILLRGVIWHRIWTFNEPLQPQSLTTEKPHFPVQPDAPWPRP